MLAGGGCGKAEGKSGQKANRANRSVDGALGLRPAEVGPGAKGAPSLLLDGDRFCEIAGFVDVATTFDGDVVTEQLHRNGCDDG